MDATPWQNAKHLTADEVLDSYVRDVARRLPVSKRDDVALELRMLLAEELAGRSEDTGRPPDARLAVEMLRAFGRPAETAVRYHVPFSILEPRDTWAFLVLAVVGIATFQVGTPDGVPATAAETAKWATVSDLTWLGLLVLGFAVKNFVLRRRPDAFPWRPRRVHDLDAVHPARVLAVVAGAVLLGVVYLWPGPIVEALTGGRVDAEQLAYTDDFASPLRQPWLIGVLVALVAVHLWALVRGRWTVGTRLLRAAFVLLTGMQLGWHVAYGSVFVDPDVEAAVFPLVQALSAALGLTAGWLLYREYTNIRPAPVSPPAAPAPAPAGPQIQP